MHERSSSYQSVEAVVLADEFRIQAKKPPGGDPHMGMIFQALSEADPESEASKAVDYIATRHLEEINPEATLSNLAGKIGSYFRMGILINESCGEGPGYADIKQSKDYATEFEKIGHDIVTDKGPVGLAIHHLHDEKQEPNTSPFSRAIPGAIVLQVTADRRPEGATVADIGSGMGTIPLQWLKNQQFPFAPDRVSSYADSFGNRNRRLQKATKALTLSKIAIDSVISLDKQLVYVDGPDRYDSIAQLYSEACLRPQTEYLNKGYMEQLRGLWSEKPDNMQYLMTDTTDDRQFKKFLAEHGRNRFDFIQLATVLNQSPEEQRLKLMERARDLLNDKGVLLILEFAWLPDSNRPLPLESLRMYEHWHSPPGRYRVFMYDQMLPQKGLQEIMRCYDSRANVVQIRDKPVVVQNKILTMREAIQLRARELTA